MGATDLRPDLERLLPVAFLWAEQQAQCVRSQGRPLAVAEAELARAVGVKEPGSVRVLVVERIPAPTDPLLSSACVWLGLLGPDTAGLTLGYGVYLREGLLGARGTVLAHELRHVAQYERYGSIGAYLAVYLPELLEYGYANAPFEVDARSVENRGV